jgi:hypothetical protein
VIILSLMDLGLFMIKLERELMIIIDAIKQMVVNIVLIINWL